MSKTTRERRELVEKLVRAGLTQDPPTIKMAVSAAVASMSRADLVQVVKEETFLIGTLAKLLEEHDPAWSVGEFLAWIRDPETAVLDESIRVLSGGDL